MDSFMPHQKRFVNPASFSVSLALVRLEIAPSTVKGRFKIGLNHTRKTNLFHLYNH